jgi:intracellular sulfur oxidation DsrE/DsrF family protein
MFMSKRALWWTAIAASAAAAFLISFFLASGARAGETAVVARHRVVFHVNVADEERWQEVLTNVENVQKAFGADQVEIEVVAHGAGIGLVERKNAALRDRIATIEKTGPVFAACTNTMKRKNLTAADLTAGVKIVDSGVAELIRRQEAGWAYIKLGY